jgi:polysaccharide pyruvyl transferase WcaK-like protein
MLEDYCDRPAGEPLSLFLWCLGARASRTRIGFVSVGAGPMHNPVNRWLMTSSARMADYRSFRDHRARDFLGSVGVDVSNDRVYPDIVFGLPEPNSMTGARPAGDGLVVGVGAMLYDGYYGGDEAALDAYVAKLADLVLRLLGRGHQVRMITGQTTDWRTVERLLHNIESRDRPVPEGRLVAEPVSSLQGVMAQIAQTDVVVAPRYHNLVCALKLGKPVVAIDYASKNRGLMADMGLAHLCQRIEELDVDRLIEQFASVVAERERYEAMIREKNADIEARLAEQESILASRLLA